MADDHVDPNQSHAGHASNTGNGVHVDPRLAAMASAFQSSLQPGAFTHLSAKAMQHWIASNQEMMRFMATRMKKDLATLQACNNCQTQSELMQVCSDAVTDTAHDYASTFETLVKINSDWA